ncbi:YLP motif protein, putative (macronuclear) [Tetrahymena thermophila SB210]|uniref:YLP motif protein, putative n=1 Tax=Tetrahymena thermophila (strain SB210) TaxID=312017 RepID=Q245M2_TETTS|nr:YLP motif protein, putative [Tetrahymena thermophila SB210]EAS03611.2 YLP motif protein, putative [Tetrahymena thermophila SB210]|eukprot:XP_001023856.2 YLP motif protein, putative [Tetrahymena thermophila SB210]
MVGATRIDSIWKAILFNNKIQTTRWLSQKELYLGHQYDGLIYMASMNNTTPSNYQKPPGCPYDGIYKLDIRCRFYYSETANNISTVTFPPQIQYADGSSYLSSTFCQRHIKFIEDNPNLESKLYSILCTTLDLQQIPQYFQNFGQNSKFQMLLDPSTQTIVYNSQQSQKYDQILTIQQVETDYLNDQNQSKIFIDNINQYKQYILNNSNSVDIFQQYDYNQNSFEYQRNGTACFVIVNIISMIDKVPILETLKSVNPQSKYQLKNIFLFLDVLSKEKMEQFSQNLYSTLQFYKILFTYSSWGLIICILIVQFYYSLQLGRYLMQPVIHLTNILNQIQIQSTKLQEVTYQNDSFLNISYDEDNQIHIDDHIFSDFEGVCYSSDTQELLYSFQNLFKILQFTTQNLYTENQSISLLNLNIQIQYFQQFGNYRALGVCHNNMGILHYNSGRFQEAIEHFQKSIIYAKYELDMYSDNDEGSSLSNTIKRFTINLRSSLFSTNSQIDQSMPAFMQQQQQQSITTEKQQLKKNQLKYFIYRQQQINEKDQLYWNLYSRNQNYLKALSCYLDEQNLYLWDIFEDITLETTSISQIYLQNSNKREMINYYVILLGYFRQNKFEEASNILRKLAKLYLKDMKKKQFFKEQEKYQTNQSSLYKKQISSPGKNQSEIFDITSQIQNITPLGNNSETLKSFTLLSPITKSFKKSISKNLQNLNFSQIDQLLSNEMIKQQNINQNLKNKQSTTDRNFDIKKFRTIQRNETINNNNVSNYKSENSRYPPSFLEMSEERSARILQENVTKENVYLGQSSYIKNFNNNSHIYNIFNFKTQGEQSQKSVNNNQDSPIKLLDRYSDLKKNKIYNIFGTKKPNQSKTTLNIQKEKSLTQSQSNQTNVSNYRIAQQSNHITQNHNDLYFQVRKAQNYNKTSHYEFNSDICFQYYAIQLAKYQLIQQNPYQAALILTNLLEQCQYYLPHLKRLALKLLNESFKMKKIKSYELTDMNEKYLSFTDFTYKVCLISVCHSKFYKKRVYALSHDLVNEVLFKEEDQFGLFSYSFDECIFIQQMSYTSIKIIKSNPFFFEKTILKIFDKEQKQRNDKNQFNNKEKLEFKKQSTNFFDRQTIYSTETKLKSQKNSSQPKKTSFIIHNGINNIENSNANLNGIDSNQLDHTFGGKFVSQKFSQIKGHRNKLNLEGREGILKNSFTSYNVQEEQIDNNYVLKCSDSSCSSIESVLASQTIVNNKKNKLENNKSDVAQQQQSKINQLNSQCQTKDITKSFEKNDRQNSQIYDPQNIQNYQLNSKMFPLNNNLSMQNQFQKNELLNQQNNQKIENDQNQQSCQLFSNRRKISNQYDNQSDFNSFCQIVNLNQINDASLFCQLSSNREKCIFQDQLLIYQNDQQKEDNLKKQSATSDIRQNLQNQYQYQGDKLINDQHEKNDNMIRVIQQIENSSENYQTLNSSRLKHQDLNSQKNKIAEYSFIQQNNQEHDQTQISSKQELKMLSNQNFQPQSFSFFQKDITSDKQNQIVNENYIYKTNINQITEKVINDRIYTKQIVDQIDSNLQNDKINKIEFDYNYEKALSKQNQYPNLQANIFQINNNENQQSQQLILKEILDQTKLIDKKDTQLNQQNDEKRIFGFNHLFGCGENLNVSDNLLSPTFKENKNNQFFTSHSNNNYEIDLNQDNKDYKQKNKQFIIANKFQYSGEQLFHLSIKAALNKYILNSDEKLSTYLSYKNHKQIQRKQKVNSISKNQQGFLIYFTDQYFQLINQDHLNELCSLLISLDLQLLILAVNEKNFIEEQANLQNIYQDGKSLVLFFNSEEKLLQYIYNNREHIKSSLIPMAVEFF